MCRVRVIPLPMPPAITQRRSRIPVRPCRLLIPRQQQRALPAKAVEMALRFIQRTRQTNLGLHRWTPFVCGPCPLPFV